MAEVKFFDLQEKTLKSQVTDDKERGEIECEDGKVRYACTIKIAVRA